MSSQTEPLYVVKMSNGRGLTEWYRSLSYRVQESRKEDARTFSKAKAEETADFCRRHGDAFSEAYFDEGKGRYVLIAEVEPAD